MRLSPSLLSLLVQTLKISHQEAVRLILTKQVLHNGRPAGIKEKIDPRDEIKVKETIIQAPALFHYVLYYKPRGIECTLNEAIPSNLKAEFLNFPPLFPVGRLDKESEGLLLMTDDGRLYNKIAHSKSGQEKEYEVEVDKELGEDFLKSMSEGIEIMGKKTRPATVTFTGPFSFRIVLTQGMNRQIRRMCYKCGFHVTQLKRTRIGHLLLGDLTSGNTRIISKEEIRLFFQ